MVLWYLWHNNKRYLTFVIKIEMWTFMFRYGGGNGWGWVDGSMVWTRQCKEWSGEEGSWSHVSTETARIGSSTWRTGVWPSVSYE